VQSPATAARIFQRSGSNADAALLADAALQEAIQHPETRIVVQVAELFRDVGRWQEFEKAMGPLVPSYVLDEVSGRVSTARRRRR